MTNYPASLNEYTTNTGMPGAAPLGTQMQGNPSGGVDAVPQQNLPGNQNTSAQLLATQLSSGSISANSVPTNVNTAPGTDSLLAQMSRGQVVLTDTTYGMSSFIPANAGAAPAVAAAPVSPVVTRPASGLAYPAPGSQNHTGN